MDGVLARVLHCKAVLGRGQSGLMRKFGVNHAPGAGLIAIDLQSNAATVLRLLPLVGFEV